ncbi:molybdate ABC transporter substrate-binding protein [Aureibacter tunicatorum]|uniref:Molybdate transport system substrate-binding protein n=1 Tax=Aureibacter tunicatorum TaxID=866807 RepID=A0AAE3XL34_9BACT|nr:molybdate ABC transporter substrate-binding protein [Aureibacter tunicatorum]MDR6238417.1 molybdate transport system substrate-binding protein [Aureibacter tunicatorum]BDD03449.1 molybdate ABC transporter substrate-binding protein [Aureibacter tunicatorum]
MSKIPYYHIFIILSIGIIFTSSCQSNKKNSESLSIATSANAQFAIKEIANVFQDSTGNDVEIIVSSSGKLASQIMEGAPYDIFISADMVYPTTLYSNGLSSQVPKAYAKGKLALWSKEQVEMPLSVTIFHKENTKIALANPETAPYGIAAVETLKKLKLYKNNKPKFVFGESISQVNQFIKSESVDFAFTSSSVANLPQFSDRGYWQIINDSLHMPILQGILLINGEKENQANAFIEFLNGETAAEILKKHGYDKP